jgi:RimJ/RimL family protein N-acetyltransferase
VRDAAVLVPHLMDAALRRHVTAGPDTIAEFRDFTRWAKAKRRRGQLYCFAIIPPGAVTPAGLIQLWPSDPGGATAEWGIVIGRAFWGSGLFTAATALLFQFAFDTLGVVRLEARTTTANRRANAALRKIGAVAEGRLRGSAPSTPDRWLWSIPCRRPSPVRPTWPARKNR